MTNLPSHRHGEATNVQCPHCNDHNVEEIYGDEEYWWCWNCGYVDLAIAFQGKNIDLSSEFWLASWMDNERMRELV